MSTVQNGQIVTNGLTLALDAGNDRSYLSGSGVTWADLTAIRNNGTLTNGPVYSSFGGGSIFFDGSNDFVGSFPIRISGILSRTVECVFYSTSSTSTRRGLMGTRFTGGSTGWGFRINTEAAKALSYYHAGTVAGVVASNANIIEANAWQHVAATYDVVNLVGKVYIKGMDMGTTTSFPTIIGAGSTGYVGAEQQLGTVSPFLGYIAIARAYNRVLSPQEILQNYNATKARFGL